MTERDLLAESLLTSLMALAKSPSELYEDPGGGDGGGGSGGGGGGNTAAARAVLSQLARLCGLTDGGDDEGGKALHILLATSSDALRTLVFLLQYNPMTWEQYLPGPMSAASSNAF